MTSLATLGANGYVVRAIRNPMDTASMGVGRIAAFIGNSISAGSSASNSVFAFPRQTIAMLGSLRLSYAGSIFAGGAGERSDQIAARLSGVLAQGAEVVFIEAGTNDSAQSVPVATFAASMSAMIAQCKRAGVPCFVLTVLPRGAAVATVTTRLLTDGYNHWIRAVAPVLGAIVVETHAAVVDTTTGDMLATCDSGDGVHPNNLGHRKIALANVAKLLAAGVSQNGLVTSLSSYNLVPNPLMVGAGSTPTSWFEQPGGTGSVPTYSIVSDTSGFLEAGRWAQMAFNAASGGTRTLATALGSGWSVGDTLAITGKVQMVDTGGNWESTAVAALTASVNTKVTNQSGVPISTDANSQSAGYLSGANYNIGPNLITFTVPVGTTSMNLWNLCLLPTGANVSFRFGAMGVINLTALGLSATLV